MSPPEISGKTGLSAPTAITIHIRQGGPHFEGFVGSVAHFRRPNWLNFRPPPTSARNGNLWAKPANAAALRKTNDRKMARGYTDDRKMKFKIHFFPIFLSHIFLSIQEKRRTFHSCNRSQASGGLPVMSRRQSPFAPRKLQLSRSERRLSRPVNGYHSSCATLALAGAGGESAPVRATRFACRVAEPNCQRTNNRSRPL